MAVDAARVVLRKRLGRAVLGGHPWLYADAVAVPAGLPSGSIVDVVDRGGQALARGVYDAESPLAVRIWAAAGTALDERLVHARVVAARELRQALVATGDTTAYRLLHGEADGLPGIVCDLYGDTAVLQLDTPSVTALAEHAAGAVQSSVPGVRRVLLKRGRRHEASAVHAIAGQLPERPLVIREHGMALEVDVVHGHKTGLYLDQRENRRRVGELAGGRSMLNLFSYSGGFAVAAALGGARDTTCVDSAAPALAAARRNFALNNLGTTGHAFVDADAFDFLAADTRRYDLVVVDPPSLAPSREALAGALRAYLRLNSLALARLAAPGLLVTCSCSSHVPEEALVGVLADAGRSSGRQVRIVEVHGAGPDHPIRPEFPEGRYLKVLIAWVT